MSTISPMRIARLFLSILIAAQAAGPALAGEMLAAPSVGPGFVPIAPVVGSTAPGKASGNLTRSRFGDITGAINRRAKDPGLVRKMWFVYDANADLERSEEAL